MKINFDSLETRRKINSLAEICHYGTSWNRLPEDGMGVYTVGGLETTAHIVACCIVQWFGIDSCGTAETRDALYLCESIKVLDKYEFKIEKWEYLITQYLKTLVVQ